MKRGLAREYNRIIRSSERRGEIIGGSGVACDSPYYGRCRSPGARFLRIMIKGGE